MPNKKKKNQIFFFLYLHNLEWLKNIYILFSKDID
jgi:hypothetical protein